MRYLRVVSLAVASLMCALPAAAHGTVASPTAQVVAETTVGVIQQVASAVPPLPTGGAALPAAPRLPGVPASPVATGGAPIATGAIPTPDPAPTVQRPLGRRAGSPTSRTPPRASPTPDPMPGLAGVLPTGQANVVLIIRINSPGNDGPITQINGASITVLRPSWTELRQACEVPGFGLANRAARVLNWATTCARALRATTAREAPALTLSRGRPTGRHRLRRHPIARPSVLRYFVPVRATIAPRSSTAPRALVHPPPHRTPRRHHRGAPRQPPPSTPVQDWVPTVPGPATTLTSGGGGGQGSAVLGLMAITCLTLLPGMIGRRAWPSSVLRETLRGSRLERPG